MVRLAVCEAKLFALWVREATVFALAGARDATVSSLAAASVVVLFASSCACALALSAAAAAKPFLALEAASPKAARAPPSVSVVVTTRTFAVPASIIPMLSAAALDRSMMRPPMNGPRSLIRTTTERPLVRFSTSTLVPNGSDRCAAVSSLGSIFSPFAVILAGSEYQEAWPSWSALARSTGSIAAAPRSPTEIILARILNMRCAPYSIVWEVREAGEESSRLHMLVRCVNYRATRRKIGSPRVIEGRFGGAWDLSPVKVDLGQTGPLGATCFGRK